MARRVDVCQECETLFPVDLHTGEGECPVCMEDVQDNREVEYDDGNLRHYTLSEEHNSTDGAQDIDDDYYCDGLGELDDQEFDDDIPWD